MPKVPIGLAGWPADGEAPPLRDPRWKVWTRPLSALLARPRRWARMMAWAAVLGVDEATLRQLVAALEEFGEAESVRHGGQMIWRRSQERERDWLEPSPAEPEGQVE